jgi:hypothetical protein
MFYNEGVFDLDKIPDYDFLNACEFADVSVLGPVQLARSGWDRIQLKFGPLQILECFSNHLKLPTPDLKGIVSSTFCFQARIREIIRFYSDPSDESKPITPEDAFNLLRLHAYGGGMRKWFQGLETGVFTTQDGVVIGKTNVKTVINNTKRDDKYWKRPMFLQALSRDITLVHEKMCDKNPCMMSMLCDDDIPLTIDDSVSNFRRQSRTMTTMLLTMEAHMSACAMKVLIKHKRVAIENNRFVALVTPGEIDYKINGGGADLEKSLCDINNEFRDLTLNVQFTAYPQLERMLGKTVPYSIFKKRKLA